MERSIGGLSSQALVAGRSFAEGGGVGIVWRWFLRLGVIV